MAARLRWCPPHTALSAAWSAMQGLPSSAQVASGTTVGSSLAVPTHTCWHPRLTGEFLVLLNAWEGLSEAAPGWAAENAALP